MLAVMDMSIPLPLLLQFPYAEQRRRQNLPRKNKRYLRGVWVALAADCRIVECTQV